MDAVVTFDGEFGVESRDEDALVLGANQDGVSVTIGEHFDSGADAGDFRRADIDHLDGSAGEFGFGDFDGGVDLASVGVAGDGDVDGLQ